MIRFFVGVLLVILTFVGSLMLEGGNPWAYFAPAIFLLVMFVPLFASLAVWKAGQITTAFRDAFKKGKASEPAMSLRIFDFYEKAFYIAGAIGLVFGAVLVLGQIVPKADARDIAHSSAVAILCILYAAFFGLVTRILKARVEERKD